MGDGDRVTKELPSIGVGQTQVEEASGEFAQDWRQREDLLLDGHQSTNGAAVLSSGLLEMNPLADVSKQCEDENEDEKLEDGVPGASSQKRNTGE